MKQRLSILLLALSALLLLGGCALEPAYRYNGNAGGGYYYGQSPYGDADTVIYSSGYARPWGWGPSWGYGPAGWWGYGGVGFGATYVYRPHHRRHYYHRHTRHDSRHHEQQRHHARPHADPPRRIRAPNRPPPVRAMHVPHNPKLAPSEKKHPVK